MPGAAHDQTGGLISSSVSPFQNFDFDQNVAKLEVSTDSGWAGDFESKHIAVVVGFQLGTASHHTSKLQTNGADYSGEAELNSAVKYQRLHWLAEST